MWLEGNLWKRVLKYIQIVNHHDHDNDELTETIFCEVGLLWKYLLRAWWAANFPSSFHPGCLKRSSTLRTRRQHHVDAASWRNFHVLNEYIERVYQRLFVYVGPLSKKNYVVGVTRSFTFTLCRALGSRIAGVWQHELVSESPAPLKLVFWRLGVWPLPNILKDHWKEICIRSFFFKIWWL